MKRYSIIFIILIACLVLSSCGYISTTADTAAPKSSTAGKTTNVPTPETVSTQSNPAQSDPQKDLNSNDPAQLLGTDVSSSVLIKALNNYSVQDMFDIYTKETDAEVKKTILKNIVLVCEETSKYYEFIDSPSLTVADLENMVESGFKIVVSHHFDSATDTQIRKMDKDKLWNKLYPLLEKGDENTASLLGQLNYPEYSDKIDAFIQSDNQHADNLRYYLLDHTDYSNSSDEEVYLAGLKYKKKGKSKGPINSIIIIDYFKDYDGEYTDEYSNYNDLVLSEKQGNSWDPSLNAVIFIKETHTYAGKYRFKELHQTAKGYRVDYKIVLVDLRTKRILTSKTLKGPKLPRKIYDYDLYDDGKYYTNPPSDSKVEKAVISVLKKYGCLDETCVD